MIVGQLRGHAAARSAVQKSNLHQEGFVNFFNGVRLFCQDGSESIHSYRPALIFLDDGEQQATIDLIEALFIHFQHLQLGLGGGEIDLAGAAHLRIVAHAPQQAIGDARRAPRPAGNLYRARSVDFDA